MKIILKCKKNCDVIASQLSVGVAGCLITHRWDLLTLYVYFCDSRILCCSKCLSDAMREATDRVRNGITTPISHTFRTFITENRKYQKLPILQFNSLIKCDNQIIQHILLIYTLFLQTRDLGFDADLCFFSYFFVLFLFYQNLLYRK